MMMMMMTNSLGLIQQTTRWKSLQQSFYRMSLLSN